MPTPTTSKDRASGRKRYRTLIFPLLAIVLGFSPFVVLEVVLRVIDVGDPADYADPFVGFDGSHPLFSLEKDQQTYRTTRSHRLYFGTQEFSARKAPNTYRVFCLGGSTVRGRPYTTETSFTRWLQIELGLRDPTRNYEVINCGGLSYASYRLARISKEVMAYEPDLVVVATGHNEFLENRTYAQIKKPTSFRKVKSQLGKLRIVKLLTGKTVEEVRESEKKTVLKHEVKARLDDQSGYASYHRDEQWQNEVVKHFQHSVRAMIKICDEHKVPLVLVGLGSNLRDCPPFKSELPAALGDSQRKAWSQAFESATLKEADPRQALEFYRKAEAIDNGHALLNYRMARCLDRLDQKEQAAKYYIRAKDTDVCPLRMVEKIYQSLLTISQETKTPLVNVRAELKKMTVDEMPGYDQYMDHVHPTIRTHQFIAQRIADQLEQRKWIARNTSLTARDRRETYRYHFAQLDKRYLLNGRRRVTWLEKWARRSLLVIETKPFDARGYLELGKRYLLFGENEYAWNEFDQALSMDPQYVEVLLNYAESFFHGGQPFQCRDMLDVLKKHELAKDYLVTVDLALLIVALELGEDKEAAELYQEQAAAFAELAKTRPCWLQTMPDALQRAEKLAAGTQ